MGLGFVKIGVDAVVCEEGVVGSVFGDAAVVEDDDAVAEFAAAHAVGDVDSGFAGGMTIFHRKILEKFLKSRRY